MSNYSDDYSALMLIFIAGFVWATWNFDYSPFGDEVYLYTQYRQCEDEKYELKCKWHNNKRASYKVNFETQLVVLLNVDDSIIKAKNCAVINKNNWSCGAGNGKYGFNNGDYTLEDSKQLRYISKTTWWWSKLVGARKVKGTW